MSGQSEEDEFPFSDGNLTGAVRVGDTVRRRVGGWSPSVHHLLRHLGQSGFEGAPRVLGFDDRGREVLGYIDGETSADPLVHFATDTSLTRVAELLRAFHDSTVTFEPPAEGRWQTQVGAPIYGDVVCHNDIAPWNTIVQGGDPVAFIDWDFAAPGPRIWDIAHALWRFTPLSDDPKFGTVRDQARRIKVFCDSYGLVERAGLFSAILERQSVLYETVKARAKEGVPEFMTLWRDGHAGMVLEDMAYLESHIECFEIELTRKA